MRRTVLVSILAALLVAPLAGCGHQVTPDRLYDSLPGDMVINFSVNTTSGGLDFTNVNYVIVLNTCGVGGEPYPNGFTTTYKNYSYSFAIGPEYANSTILPSFFEYYISGGVLRPFQYTLGSSTTTFIPDLYGDNSTFQLTFTRAQLNNPLNIQNPTPCVSVGGTDNASTWYINFFTLDQNYNVLDSLGVGGPTDTTFNLPIDILQPVQKAITRPAGSIHASNPAAWITGGQINNYP